MPTSVIDTPDNFECTSEEIDCPTCLGRGKFNRRELLERIGFRPEGLEAFIWSIEELLELESRRRRERQEEMMLRGDDSQIGRD